MKLDTATQGKKDNDGVRKRTVPSLRGTQEARQRKKVENASQADSSSSGSATRSPGKTHRRYDALALPQRPRLSPSKRHTPTKAQQNDKPVKESADDRDYSRRDPSPIASLRAFPNVVKRKASATMPGSLFPRSASIEPDPTPGPTSYGLLQERIRPPVPVSRTPTQPNSTKGRSTTRPSVTRSPEEPNPFLGITNTLARARGVVASTDDAKRFLEDYNPSPPSSPSPAIQPSFRGSTKSAGSHDEVAIAAIQFKGKGKQRAQDDEFEWEDDSRVLRVKGKERELREAREEQSRKEKETELDPETTMIMEERYRDKERILKLEAEVAWLKSQVSIDHVVL